MDPLPSWLEDAVAAAGMTAYAFDMDSEVSASFPTPIAPFDASAPPPLF